MTKKKAADLSAIEAEYRAGQLSVCEIARRHGTHEKQVRRWAEKYSWSRDLTEEVRQGVKNAVVRAVSEKVSVRGKSDEQVLDSAVKRGTDAVKGHLARAEAIKSVVDKMLAALNVQLDTAKGRKAVARMLLGKSDGFANLVRAACEGADRIQKLERQALSLDDDAKKDDTPVNVHMNYAGRA